MDDSCKIQLSFDKFGTINNIPSELVEIVTGGGADELFTANRNRRCGENIVCGNNGACVTIDPFGGNPVNIGC